MIEDGLTRSKAIRARIKRQKVARAKQAKGYEAERATAVKAGNDLPPEIQHKRRQADPIINLRSRNLLTERQFLAAIDIREAVIGVDAAALGSSSDPDRFAMAGVSLLRRFWSNLDWNLIEKQRRYRRWRRKTRRHKVGGKRGLTLHGIAWSVVVEGVTPASIDSTKRMRKGSAIKWLREALDVF